MADNILTMRDDWGGFRDPNGVDRAATGREVQNFIKSQLGSKTGYIHSTDTNTTTTLLGFADESSYEAWVQEGNDNKDNPDYNALESSYIVFKTTFAKSIPEPYQTAYVESLSPSNIISLDGKVTLNFVYHSLDNEFSESAGSVVAKENGYQGILTIEKRSGNNWDSIYLGQIDSAKEMSIDISKDCNEGTQQIRLSVTTIPAEGKSSITTSYVFYNITKTVVDLIYADDWSKAQKSSSMTLSFGILGIVNKKLHVEISGAGGETPRKIVRSIGTSVYNTTIGQASYNFSLTDTIVDSYKVLKHGVHNIRAWIEVVETGEMVAERNIQIMMATDANDTESYLLLNNVNTEPINWTSQHLFDYCIYSPTNTVKTFTAILSQYNSTTEYLKLGPIQIDSNSKLSYENSLEIESQDAVIYAPMSFYIDNKKVRELQISISNSGEYGPTPGACFILDPKSRSNYEENPNIIYNKVTGKEVNSNWDKGAKFNFNNDAWIDSADKSLRVLAGQVLEIDYNPFYSAGDDSWAQNSCTIEMSVAVRNIIDDDIPIIKMCTYNDDGTFNGIEFLPNSAALMTQGQNLYKNQDIVFREGVKTHIAFNIIDNFQTVEYTDGDGNKKTKQINLVRIFVNGRINREFAYNTGDVLYDTDSTRNPRKIIIGTTEKHGGADVDIYNIRVYKKKLDSINVFNNYISTLATADEKDAEIFANDITVNGIINYAKASEKYNTLLWRPRSGTDETTSVASFSTGEDAKFKGELVINVLTTNDNGEIVEDPTRSGILKDLRVKGQGTSSMTYWKWNQRWEFDKIKTGEKDEKGEDIYHETLFYANDGSEPIGSWLVEEGSPRAKRIDGKINWASPMQSHKMGSTALYNDLWRQVVGGNAITKLGATEEGQKFTGTPGGYGDCRVAIKQLPFMLFEQKVAGGDIEFVGLYTVGASKGDKPTFGYDKNNVNIKPFLMMEGCDNGAPLVSHRIPWNDVDITIPAVDDDGDIVGEVFVYNDADQWEISMGDKKRTTLFEYVDGVETNVIKSKPLKLFKDMCNFLYTINPDIHPFLLEDGTPGSNFNDPDQTNHLSQQSFYWVVRNSDYLNQYDLYRYHEVLKKWVNSGIERLVDADGKVLEDYETLNLKTQCEGIYNPVLIDYNTMNQNFINARVKIFNDGIENYIHKDDLLYTMQFLKLIAASDNWAKNTYLYSTGLDENGNAEKFRFFQDDLDTIFASNNTGQKTKPYYLEEHDVDESGANYWNASTNALYCLAEMAWPVNLRSTMYKILSAMKQLGGSVEGCFDKYYNFVQTYFPAVAYNEIARILYEDAKINKDRGIYGGVEPLSQCLGDQLQAEKYWQNMRIPYISSYAMYGEFSARDGLTNEGAFTFRSTLVDGKPHNYNLKLTPYMWIYPSIGVGSSPSHDTDTIQLTRRRAGETFETSFSTDGNTNIFVRGINYYKNIDDFGNVATALDQAGKNVTINGKRLTDFIVTDNETEKGILFRPSTLSFADAMVNLQNIKISGSAYGSDIITGDLDLSSLWRLKTVDLTGTKATAVYFPENSNIDTIKLPDTMTKLELINLSNLSNLELGGCSKIQRLEIRNCSKLNSYDIFNMCYENESPLEIAKLYGIDWKNIDIKMVEYLMTIPECDVTGYIEINKDADVTFDLKMQLIDKFGNIDDPNNDLYIDYTKKSLSGEEYVKILGASNVYKVGNHQFTLNYPTGPDESANDFTSIVWSVNNSQYCSINNSGVLTYKGGASMSDKVKVRCTIMHPNQSNPKGLTVEKEVALYPRLAQVGDYVYADGSYGAPEEHTGYKEVIATCFYVDGNKDVTKQKRLAVSAEVLNTDYGYFGEQKDIEEIPNIYSSGTGYMSADNYVGYWYICKYDVESYLTDPNKFQSTALADMGWNAEGKPMGYVYTNAIIKQRDNALTTAQLTKPNPADTSKSIDALLKSITGSEDNKKAKRMVYYPAASYCVEYQPKVDNLAPEFKMGKWFLPSIGELAQIWYQIYHGGKSSFDAYKQSGTKSFIEYYRSVWSSSEYGSTYGWALLFRYYDERGGIAGSATLNEYIGDKSMNHLILPIVEF